MLRSIICNTLRMGCRNHGLKIILLFSAILLAIAWLGGSFSPRQPQTVALDIGISVLRILLTLLTLFWVQELIGREIDRKTILWSLSYPHSRAKFLLGRYAGIFILLLGALLICATTTQLASILAVGKYQQSTPVNMYSGFWTTILVFSVDLLAVSSFALVVASISTVPMLPFFTGLAFAICARSIGPTLAYLNSSSGQIDANAQSLAGYMNTIGWLLPDLSRLDIRTMTLYGTPADWNMVLTAITQTTSFSIIMVFLACFAFHRRQFS